jgi:hypothetical protein
MAKLGIHDVFGIPREQMVHSMAGSDRNMEGVGAGLFRLAKLMAAELTSSKGKS